MKKRIWEILEVGEGTDRLSMLFDKFMMTLICLNFIAIILESEEILNSMFGYYFRIFEIFSIVVFTIEYIGRLWSCTSDHKFSSPITGRIKYFFTPLVLIDLIAILPFYLTFLVVDVRFLRVFRVFRFLRLSKQIKYMKSFRVISEVLTRKKAELTTSVIIMVMMMLIAATLMYYAEHDAQPEKFSSIIGSMWWAIETLTTVGYGDVVPESIFGKIAGGLICLSGVLTFALPTAILSSSFVEVMGERKNKMRQRQIKCPHCGNSIETAQARN
jgi:voltage-gated potassium channel